MMNTNMQPINTNNNNEHMHNLMQHMDPSVLQQMDPSVLQQMDPSVLQHTLAIMNMNTMNTSPHQMTNPATTDPATNNNNKRATDEEICMEVKRMRQWAGDLMAGLENLAQMIQQPSAVTTSCQPCFTAGLPAPEAVYSFGTTSDPADEAAGTASGKKGKKGEKKAKAKKGDSTCLRQPKFDNAINCAERTATGLKQKLIAQGVSPSQINVGSASSVRMQQELKEHKVAQELKTELENEAAKITGPAAKEERQKYWDAVYQTDPRLESVRKRAFMDVAIDWPKAVAGEGYEVPPALTDEILEATGMEKEETDKVKAQRSKMRKLEGSWLIKHYEAADSHQTLPYAELRNEVREMLKADAAAQDATTKATTQAAQAAQATTQATPPLTELFNIAHAATTGGAVN